MDTRWMKISLRDRRSAYPLLIKAIFYFYTTCFFIMQQGHASNCQDRVLLQKLSLFRLHQGFSRSGAQGHLFSNKKTPGPPGYSLSRLRFNTSLLFAFSSGPPDKSLGPPQVAEGHLLRTPGLHT